MSLFRNLVDTYDVCQNAVGIEVLNNSGEADAKRMLLPVFHMTLKTLFCVTLDVEGKLLRIERDEKEKNIVIPCTEDSANRTVGIAAHALCDQLGYVDNTYDQDKFSAYISLLRYWKGDNKKLNAICTYLSSNSVIADIHAAGLFKDAEISSDMPVPEKIQKYGVRFSVEGRGILNPHAWEDIELRNLWTHAYVHLMDKNQSRIEGFDYLTGNKLSVHASAHPKNINVMSSGAKLLSCNDNQNFTYRGRFAEQNDAILVDAISSQKAHWALKWLISNNAELTETQAIVVWAVDEEAGRQLKPFGSTWELLQQADKLEMDSDILIEANNLVDKDYSKLLTKVLLGYRKANELANHTKKMVIAAFDAATTGRMSVVFYSEQPKEKYLDSIAKWHQDMQWHIVGFKETKDEKGKTQYKRFEYVGCPSFTDILAAVYGTSKGASDKSYATLKRNVKKMLLECMFGNSLIPKNYVLSAANRASSPLSFCDSDGKFNSYKWNEVISTSCAMTRKHFKDIYKEELSMQLETTRRDRDYLYGRLLAIADRIEDVAMYKANKTNDRPTNAVKLMHAFSVKPYSTWGILWKQLTPYIAQLQGAGYYRNIIQDICTLFREGEYENDAPLSPLYILGFNTQGRALKSNKDKQEENNNENTTEQD